METIQELKDLGFDQLAKKLEAKEILRQKLYVAYQNFEFITQDDYTIFNKNLREKTQEKHNGYYQYDKLTLTSLNRYTDLPPQDVLEKLRQAKDLGCFDTFEIAKIESIKEVIDPILFGRINGCSDLFFIAEWDHDVKFADIKRPIKNIENLN